MIKKIIFQPRQKNKLKFVPAGSMYFSKISNIQKNIIIGKNFFGYVVSGKYSISIDDKEDFFLAEKYFEKKSIIIIEILKIKYIGIEIKISQKITE